VSCAELVILHGSTVLEKPQWRLVELQPARIESVQQEFCFRLEATEVVRATAVRASHMPKGDPELAESVENREAHMS
jgi:hypothetical protein